MTYIIVKEFREKPGMFVILNDGGSEIMEFDERQEADRIQMLFQKNSTDCNYIVRQIK